MLAIAVVLIATYLGMVLGRSVRERVFEHPTSPAREVQDQSDRSSVKPRPDAETQAEDAVAAPPMAPTPTQVATDDPEEATEVRGDSGWRPTAETSSDHLLGAGHALIRHQLLTKNNWASYEPRFCTDLSSFDRETVELAVDHAAAMRLADGSPWYDVSFQFAALTTYPWVSITGAHWIPAASPEASARFHAFSMGQPGASELILPILAHYETTRHALVVKAMTLSYEMAKRGLGRTAVDGIYVANFRPVLLEAGASSRLADALSTYRDTVARVMDALKRYVADLRKR